MILVRGAGMEEVLVVHELDVSDVEDHVQGEALAGVFEYADGFALGGGEGGDDAAVGEALEGLDVVGVVSGEKTKGREGAG